MNSQTINSGISLSEVERTFKILGLEKEEDRKKFTQFEHEEEHKNSDFKIITSDNTLL